MHVGFNTLSNVYGIIIIISFFYYFFTFILKIHIHFIFTFVFITSVKEAVFFHLCLIVCLLVCQQDYTQATKWISMKLGWRMGLGPRIDPIYSWCRSSYRNGSKNFFSLSKTLRDRAFFLHFHLNYAWILMKKISRIYSYLWVSTAA